MLNIFTNTIFYLDKFNVIYLFIFVIDKSDIIRLHKMPMQLVIGMQWDSIQNPLAVYGLPQQKKIVSQR